VFCSLLLGKTQEKHPGDLQSMVPDLLPQPPNTPTNYEAR